jgi:hypothetical protein
MAGVACAEAHRLLHGAAAEDARLLLIRLEADADRGRLRVWLPAPAGHARMLYLERSSAFAERQRAVLELLRPSLIRIHAAAFARRRATAAP